MKSIEPSSAIKFSQLQEKFWTNRLVVGKSIVIKHPKDWFHNTIGEPIVFL
jgi:hypothetical protein